MLTTAPLLMVAALSTALALPCLEGPDGNGGAQGCESPGTADEQDVLEDEVLRAAKVAGPGATQPVVGLLVVGPAAALGVVLVGAACVGVFTPAGFLVALPVALLEVALVHGALGLAASAGWAATALLARRAQVPNAARRSGAVGAVLAVAWLASLGVALGGMGASVGLALTTVAFFWWPVQGGPQVPWTAWAAPLPTFMTGATTTLGLTAGLLATAALAVAILGAGQALATLLTWRMFNAAPTEQPASAAGQRVTRQEEAETP